MARSGTLALSVLWAIEGPRSWLPTWTAAALVGAWGVITNGGAVTLMLPRAALINIWGHKKGVRSFPVWSQSHSLPRYCYHPWPEVLIPGGLSEWYMVA